MSQTEQLFTIRTMTEKDIEEALQMIASNGLFSRAAEVSVFMRCDQNQFFVAVCISDQKIIGVCASPTTSHSTAFFGLYCVHKEYQGKGIGSALFDACLARNKNRNCGLISVNNMAIKYQNKGFTIKGFDLAVYAGIPDNIDSLISEENVDRNISITEFQSSDELINKIIAYDTRVQNYNREKLIKLTLLSDGYYTLIANDCDNNILGFGCVKLNIIGQKAIGPVYADSDSIAEALIVSLIKQFTSESEFVIMNAFVSLNGGTTIAEKLKLRQIDVYCDLYSKYCPPINRQYIYSIYSTAFSC